MRSRQASQRSRLSWLKDYAIGLGLGSACALYGVIALLTRHTFLPGLRGGHASVAGSHAVALALAYLSGGLYLVLRFFVHKRCRSEFARGQVYLLENLLLIVLIGSLVYVLLKVGAAG